MDPTTIILLLAGLTGFYMAWNIGANDLANSMGTSVGSGALTIRRAVLVASVLTIVGAILVGGHVTETVCRGIVDIERFSGNPHVMMIGALSALIAAGLWVTVSTYYGLPISTTHSIVGAMIGFGLITAGYSSVNMSKVITIVSSWVLSPISGAVVAFLVFMVVRKFVLNSKNPAESAARFVPFFVFLVFGIISVAVFTDIVNLGINPHLMAFVVGTVAALTSYILLKKYLSHKKQKNSASYESVEHIFNYVQILTACYMAFAHGANDVANAIGPVATIFSVVKTGVISTKTEVPLGLLTFGGLGIAIGMMTWGYRVMATIGRKITDITPTRGFAAEFGTATTVLVCSRLGLPISTSHTIVGAIVGVGAAGGMEALDLGVVRRIITSWLLTLPVSAMLTVFIYLTLGNIL